MSKLGGEKGAVQNPLIKYATEIGWNYVSPDDALGLRGGESGLVFRQVLLEQLTTLNSFMTPDVVFLINGVPILIGETKAAHKTDGIQWALDQAKRYHKEAPEFTTLLQLYALTHILRFYYSSTWNFSRKWLFDWKEEAKGDFES